MDIKLLNDVDDNTSEERRPLRRRKRASLTAAAAAAAATPMLDTGKRKSPTQANGVVGMKPNNKRQVIHAMLKGQVTLACNLQPADQDDAVSLVLWYKDKSMVPIYR